MSEIIRYSQSGHKFIIDGDMVVGGTIEITAVPLDGYEFVKWYDGDITNPREYNITECGITLIAEFAAKPQPSCDFENIYTQLNTIISNGDTTDYTESLITCEDIDKNLSIIIDGNN